MHAVSNNSLLLRKLLIVTVLMFGFGFALVPFYKKICEVTGINGTRTTAETSNTQVDPTRWVNIELVANTAQGMGWRFRPLQTSVRVNPGALTEVMYEIHNPAPYPVKGRAVPSYGPPEAIKWFKKIECFCFTDQTLGPNETRKLPVQFVIDPAAPKDMRTVSLSYTFFELARNGGAR